MEDKTLGYNTTMEDSEGNEIYPTTSIDNIIDSSGSLNSVNNGIIWDSEFVSIDDSKIYIIHVKCKDPKHIMVTPTAEYNPDYKYYVNSNIVSIKTNAKDSDIGISWQVGVPILCTYINGILYVPSSKNQEGVFLNNNPVEIKDISTGDLLQYVDGKIIPYQPPVLRLYTGGQIKGWEFCHHGSENAQYPSKCEAASLRVCVFGNGDVIRGTSVCTSDVYDFSNYTHIVIKYVNGEKSFTPLIQIITADEDAERAVIVDVPYTNTTTSISMDISSYKIHKAKVQISVTANENNIHEIAIYDIKLV